MLNFISIHQKFFIGLGFWNGTQSIVYCHTLYFCFKQMFFEYSTVNFREFMIINNATYFAVSILSMFYIYTMKPMKSKILNYIEMINDIFILWTGYFIFIFSDFILSPKDRYKLGYIYQYTMIAVLVLNFMLIILECKQGFDRKNLEKKFN